MEIMIGRQISMLRKQKGVTQEDLASYLGVSNQAVSKWEANTCYPDIQLLPQIAEYFNTDINVLLLGGVADSKTTSESKFFPDDNKLRIAIFRGNTMLKNTEDQMIHVTLEEALSDKDLNISILGDAQVNGDVNGGVSAGGDLVCEGVSGGVHAGGDIQINGDVKGSTTAGGDIMCRNVNGSATCGGGIRFK